MLICDRAHHRANGKAVKIVVNKNQAAQKTGGKLRAGAGTQFAGSPAAVCCGTAGFGNHRNQGSQQNNKQQQSRISAHFFNHQIRHAGKHARNAEIRRHCINNRAGKNAAGQRKDHFFGQQSQHNRNQRRQYRPKSNRYRFHYKNSFHG